MDDRLSIALWASNIEPQLQSLGEWVANTALMLERARIDGARLLVMPEYASSQWLSFAPDDLAPHEEVPWLAAQEERALRALEPHVARQRVALVAGTIPHDRGDGRYTNRATVLFPDGSRVTQAKLALTPGEQVPTGWHLTPGTRIKVFNLHGWRLAVVICLDIELPALGARLSALDLDLIVVPSMTRSLSGCNRVFTCAKARAVELLTPVAVVGAVGNRPQVGLPQSNVSGAAVFLPCEESLGSTGLGPATDIVAATAGPGPYLLAKNLPLGFIRRLRRVGAEAWPGHWGGEHVVVVDPARKVSTENY